MENGFAYELEHYGPSVRHRKPSLGEARLYCRRLAHTHYENFSVASLLLPRRLLPHFHAVYAWCRWADDLADEVGSEGDSPRLLRWWREELQRCYDGQPRHPVLVALQPTIRRFAIPPRPFLDLLLAFEQDQRVKRYETREDLLAYCRHSANPVGHLILYLGEVFDPRRAALSDCVCTGLQLANFWQDVARDLAIGRVYLPREDRERFGYGDEELEGRRFTPAFAALLRFEVERTRDLFDQGAPLVALMPDDLQADIALFVEGGRAILRKIEQAGYDVWARRPKLARWDKGALLAGAAWRRLRNVLPAW